MQYGMDFIKELPNFLLVADVSIVQRGARRRCWLGLSDVLLFRLCVRSDAADSSLCPALLLCLGITPNHFDLLLLWQH